MNGLKEGREGITFFDWQGLKLKYWVSKRQTVWWDTTVVGKSWIVSIRVIWNFHSQDYKPNKNRATADKFLRVLNGEILVKVRKNSLGLAVSETGDAH